MGRFFEKSEDNNGKAGKGKVLLLSLMLFSSLLYALLDFYFTAYGRLSQLSSEQYYEYAEGDEVTVYTLEGALDIPYVFVD